MMRMPSISKLLASCLLSAIIPAAASAQSPCEVYSVKAGDTLGSISQAAYGTFDYQNVFNANRNSIGSNPNDLAPGTQIVLPCEDGSLPGTQLGETIQQQEDIASQRTNRVSNTYEPPIKLVTGGGWEPFTSEILTGGGFLVRLATTSLQRGNNTREYNVSFVNDWGAHTEVLLPLGAFDVSIAWYMPDCSRADLLSDNDRWRCTQVDSTQPVYESVIGYFTRADSPYASARDWSDYAGATFCRPDGWYLFDLEQEGLTEPTISLLRPAGQQECVQALLSGEADVSGIEVEAAAELIPAAGAAGQIVENPYLINLLSLSFITHKTNPRGRVYIAMLNRGLNEMRESGEWYDIIATTLREHNERIN